MSFYFTEQFTIGCITLYEENGFLSRLEFSDSVNYSGICSKTRLISEAFGQLAEYFAGTRKQFSLPLKITAGTPFQLAVLNALSSIPYGETESYSSLAAKIGHPKACRAVGTACHNNTLPVFIPCHRVIGANRKLVGFGGGLDKKAFLLDLEKRVAVSRIGAASSVPDAGEVENMLAACQSI